MRQPYHSVNNVKTTYTRADNSDQATPKPFGTGQYKPFGQEKAPFLKNNLKSPFASSFAKDVPFNPQRRHYSQISHNTSVKEPYKQSTPYYTFEDNSTIKPNENTIIRNPTLIRIDEPGGERLNKSQNIRPINLSKIEFAEQDDDEHSDYHSAFDQTPLQINRMVNRTTNVPTDLAPDEKKTSREIQEICFFVSQMINQIMTQEANPLLQDIGLSNPTGENYEMSPYQFIMTNQQRIPISIIKEMNEVRRQNDGYLDFGFLDSSQTAYFCLNKRLHIWPFALGINQDCVYIKSQIQSNPIVLDFEQNVTAVALVNPLPNMISTEDKVLLVATASMIKAYTFKRNNRDSRIEVLDSNLSLPAENYHITKIVQMKKNGRVFYGGANGHVNELKLEPTSKFDIIPFLSGERKKLKKKDLESENLIVRLMPQFLGFSNRKSLVDIKIDEQRNMLYSHCTSLEDQTINQTVIEVFDLGILSNLFRKVVTIRQYQVVEKMYEYLQRDKILRGRDIFELANDYKIVYVQPIQFSESQMYHLLLITENAYRIYIQFEQYVEEIRENQLNEKGAINDLLIENRFTKNWHIVNVMYLPDEEDFIDSVNITNPGVFSAVPLSSKSQRMQLDMQAVCYDNNQSCLAFIRQVTPQMNSDDMNVSLRVNFITKNESTYAHNNQLQISHGHIAYDQSPTEQYSLIQVLFDQPRPRNQPRYSQFEDYERPFIRENILELQQNPTFLLRETQKLLGYSRSHLDYKGYMATSIQNYLSINIFEKQVYMLPYRTNILTDHRIIEIQQTRPIDQLAMLLHTMGKQDSIDDFEDFMDLYSIRETFVMLLQIVVDSQGQYLFGKKIEDKILRGRKRESQSQPRQRGAAGSKSSMIYQQSPYANRAQSSIQYVQDLMRSNIGTCIYDTQDPSSVYSICDITNESKLIALELYQKYGDTILASQFEIQIPDESLNGVPTSTNLLSNKQYALYTFAQRVLRPIWETKVTYLDKDSTGAEQLMPTFESLNGPKQKLRDLLMFIKSNKSKLFGDSGKNTKGNGSGLFYKKILEKQVITIQDFIIVEERKKYEIMEKNSLQNLITFVHRCLDTIEFIELISFHQNLTLFKRMVRELDPDEFLEFSSLKFNDVVNASSNRLLRKILDIFMNQNTDNNEIPTETLRARETALFKIGQTFFQEDESKMFLGENYLRRAVIENDIEKKQHLIKAGVDLLIQNPIRVDMNKVPELLGETGNYTTLADIILRKLKALKSLSELERSKLMDEEDFSQQISECYGVLVSLFGAIDKSITRDETIKLSKDPREQDIFQFFYRKLKNITRNEVKIELLQRILKRIEQFGDQVLLLTIYDYLLQRPQGKFNIDILPQISEEQQNVLFDQLVFSQKIQKEKFDSIVKLLLKKYDAIRLSQLSLNICSDKQEVNNQNDKKYAFSMSEKRNLIDKSIFLLEQQKAKLDNDTFNTRLQLLKSLEKLILNQINALPVVEERMQGLRNQLGEQVGKQGGPIQDQRLRELLVLYNQLQDKIFEKNEYLQMIEKHNLYQLRIQYIYEREEQQKNNNLQILNDQAISLVEFIMESFPKDWKNIIKEKIRLFVNYREVLQIMIENVQSRIDIKCAKAYIGSENILSSDIQKAISGNNLGDSVFWFIEYILSYDLIKIKPSQLMTLLCKDQKRVNKGIQQNETERNHLQELNYNKRMVFVRLWARKNKEMFKSSSTLVNKNLNRSFTLQPATEQEEFIIDLKSSCQNIYNQFDQQIKSYIDNNKYLMEPSLENQMRQLLELAKNDLRQMLSQHKIELLQESPQKQQQFTVPRSNSRSYIQQNQFGSPASLSQTFVGQQQMMQQSRDSSFSRVERQNNHSSDMSLDSNNNRSRSLIALRPFQSRPQKQLIDIPDEEMEQFLNQ